MQHVMSPGFIGAAIGSLFVVLLFGLLFRYALLGGSSAKWQQVAVVFLAALSAIGINVFGNGTEGFRNRVSDTLSLHMLAVFLGAAVIVAALLAFKKAPHADEAQNPDANRVGRGLALLIVVPMIALGLTTFLSSAYQTTIHGFKSPSARRRRVGRCEIKCSMVTWRPSGVHLMPNPLTIWTSSSTT